MMNKKQKVYYLNMMAPNLVNVCIDENGGGEFSGKIYDACHENPEEFDNLMQLLYNLEDFYDNLDFPQASTQSRCFHSPRRGKNEKLEVITAPEHIFEERGRIASFAIWVRMRQNATWQGDIIWLERDEIFSFISVLDMVKIINNIAMEAGQKSGVRTEESENEI